MSGGEFANAFRIPPPPGGEPRRDVKALSEVGSAKAAIEAVISAKAYQRVENVAVYLCTCQRCPKTWLTLQQTKPKTCPACRSAWWDRPPTPKKPRQSNGSGETKKHRKKSVKGGKVGRPRKNAIPNVEAARTPQRIQLSDEAIPEVPMELLGTVGGSVPAQVAGGGEPRADEEAFPVATPFNSGVPVPPVPEPPVHTQVETGLPTDDGGSQNDPVEGIPPALDDDWWRN